MNPFKKTTFLSIAILLSSNISFSHEAENKSTENKPVEKKEHRPISFIGKMFEEAEAIHKRMEEIFEKMEKDMFDAPVDQTLKPSVKAFRLQEGIQVKEDDKTITILIKLPESEEQYKNISVEANEDNLEGVLEHNKYKLAFKVIDGGFLNVTMSYNELKEENKEDKKSHSSFMGSFSQGLTLPSSVANLEQAEISREEGTLKLVLPKQQVRKGWKKIEVQNVQK